MASMTNGSELNVAVSEPRKPSFGVDTQMISQGNKPRTRKTAKRMPHTKNQRWARFDIVLRTSALITALSILLIVSKRHRPRTMRIMERMSMNVKEEIEVFKDCCEVYFFAISSNISCGKYCFLWLAKMRKLSLDSMMSSNFSLICRESLRNCSRCSVSV